MIRDATDPDLPAIAALYNHYVATSDATLQLSPVQPEDFRGRLALLMSVASDGTLAGFGGLSAWSTREGYRFTAEDSVYVRHDLRGRGHGRALLGALVERAQALKLHCLIARMSAAHVSSLELHRAFGFAEVGRLREVGHKLGRWVDVIIAQRLL